MKPVWIERGYRIPFEVASGDEIIAIGDIHGMSDLLRAMFDRIVATPARGRRILVQLGDLIDRGPDSLGAIDLMRTARDRVGAEEVHQLMGNHEQMAVTAFEGCSDKLRRRAFKLWIANGGAQVMAEAFGPSWRSVHASDEVSAALGLERIDFLSRSKANYRSGNLLFVHAGIDPRRSVDECLAAPKLMDLDRVRRQRHSAWITAPFLNATSRGDGLFIVHGHTPADGLHRVSGDAVQHDRLNIDMGSHATHMGGIATLFNDEVRVATVALEGAREI